MGNVFFKEIDSGRDNIANGYIVEYRKDMIQYHVALLHYFSKPNKRYNTNWKNMYLDGVGYRKLELLIYCLADYGYDLDKICILYNNAKFDELDAYIAGMLEQCGRAYDLNIIVDEINTVCNRVNNFYLNPDLLYRIEEDSWFSSIYNSIIIQGYREKGSDYYFAIESGIIELKDLHYVYLNELISYLIYLKLRSEKIDKYNAVLCANNFKKNERKGLMYYIKENTIWHLCTKDSKCELKKKNKETCDMDKLETEGYGVVRYIDMHQEMMRFLFKCRGLVVKDAAKDMTMEEPVHIGSRFYIE